MFVIAVYDTEKTNCAKMHKFLKKYLNWNQRSVFEGTVTEAQFEKIKVTLEKIRVPESHIVLYCLENDKFLEKIELGEGEGNTSNIL